jgi:hypothetical protein
MSKKMKVLISVLVAILVFAIGGTTLALAQNGDVEDAEEEEMTQEVFPGIGSGELLSRVAEKLGITEDELREAIQQAQGEIAEESLTDYLNQLLDKALAEGLLNESEVQEIKGWWADRPDALTPALLNRAFRTMPRERVMERLRDRIRLSDEETCGASARRSGNAAALGNPSPGIRVLKMERARQQLALSEK